MNAILRYIVFLGGAVLAYFEPVMLLVHVVIALFVADLITGVSASIMRGRFLKSRIARQSFIKMIVYIGHVLLVFFVAEHMKLSDEVTQSVIKVVIWAVVYVEALSVNENLLSMFPQNRFIRFMHYVLSVEFLQYFPFLAKFFKADDDTQNPADKAVDKKDDQPADQPDGHDTPQP